MTRAAYDFYADMYETHTEIGYLLWIIIALVALDGGLGIALWQWPHPDVYLVPGIDSYGQVSVQWGAHQPTMPPPAVVPAESVVPITLRMPVDAMPGAMPAAMPSDRQPSDRPDATLKDPLAIGWDGSVPLTPASASSSPAVR